MEYITIASVPTFAEITMPVDIITEYIRKGDDTSFNLWKFCVDQWGDNYYAFNPWNFFAETSDNTTEDEIEPEYETSLDSETDALLEAVAKDAVIDEDSDQIDPGDELDKELEESDIDISELSIENREMMILYAPYIGALKEFWTSMMIFTEDNSTVPNWESVSEGVMKYIAHVPKDRERLIRHIHRLNRGRLEAELLKPITNTVNAGMVLFDIQSTTF